MKQRKKAKRSAAAAMVLAALCGATGCLQLDMDIELHKKDAGATVTERLRISRTLLDLAQGRPGGVDQAVRHLNREAALSRMAHMGEGMTLQRHEIVELEDGSRESVAVYRIPDVENMRMLNPILQMHAPVPMARIVFTPYRSGPYAGQIRITLQPAEDVPQPENPEAWNSSPDLDPRDMQVYRDLQPIYADLMKDFQVRTTVTIPDQPRARGRPAGARTVDLLSFHGRHLDGSARRFIENQEAMAALLRFDLNHASILDHTRDFENNPQLPVHRGRVPWASYLIRIHPTPYLREKHFSDPP